MKLWNYAISGIFSPLQPNRTSLEPQNAWASVSPVIAACHKAGFEPTLGPSVPQLVTIVQLVAAEIGVSLVAASLQAFQIKGVVFKEIHDVSPTTRLSLAWRRADTSPFLKSFLANAFA